MVEDAYTIEIKHNLPKMKNLISSKSLPKSGSLHKHANPHHSKRGRSTCI